MIRSVNGVKVQRELDLHRAVLGRKTGQLTDVKVGRSKAETDLSIVLTAGNRPQRTRSSGLGRSEPTPGGLACGVVRPSSDPSWAVRDASYNGGLRVTAVKGDGLASRHGIRAGDILVGMHVWETASLRDLDYVLNKAQLVQGEEIQFYVLRDEKTRVGQLPLLRR